MLFSLSDVHTLYIIGLNRITKKIQEIPGDCYQRAFGHSIDYNVLYIETYTSREFKRRF